MKAFKLTVLIIAIFSVLSLMGISAFAADTAPTQSTSTTEPSTEPSTEPTTKPAVSGDWTYVLLTQGNAQITKYSGKDKKVTIPSKLGEKSDISVVAIGESIIEGNNTLEEIIIPSSVKQIDEKAFSSCYSLKTVRLENSSVESFNMLFTPFVEELYLPASLKTLGNLPDSKALKSITVDSKNTIFLSHEGVVYTKDTRTLVKFPAAKAATRFIVPYQVYNIIDNAFYNVSSVKEIYIQKTLKSISEKAFDNCLADIVCQLKENEIPTNWKKALAGRKIQYGVINLEGPKKVISDQNATAIKLTWSKSANATGYQVFFKKPGGWQLCKTTTATSVLFTKLPQNTNYTFAVRAYNQSGNKVTFSYNYTTHETGTTAPAPAKIAAQQNTSAIRLQWVGVTNADGYQVFFKKGNSWQICKTTTATNVLFSNLPAGAKYTFAVRPYRQTADKVIFGAYKTFITCTTPAAPAVLAAANKDRSTSVSWNAVNGAEKYIVYFKVKGGNWTQIGVYNGVKTATTQALPVGTQISFAVRAAINTNGGYVIGGFNTKTVTVK